MPPQRRQSLAPTSNANRSRQVLGRKRAQSLVPSEANRQLVPRKSILKSTSFNFGLNAGPSQGNENEPPTQTGILDDRTMDNTGINYTAEISDNTTRKSLGRRVSFAPLASFRVFETNDNTNSTGGPSSSPTPPSPAEPDPSPSPVHPLPPIQLSNENDYPGRRSNTGPLRRVSVLSDYGERSMSLDMDQESDDTSEPPTDPVFFEEAANAGSDYGPPSTDFEDGTEDEHDEDDEDMEITEAIAMSIDRKRSLSIAQQHEIARRSSLSSLAYRRRSSTRFPSEAQSELDGNEKEGSVRDDEDVATNTQATQESEAPMEFTIAVGQPLREPRPPSEAWLALKAITNSTEDAEEDQEDMKLSNALSRLQQARSSLVFPGQDEGGDNSGIMQDASFTNSESSMDDSIDAGDRTLNITSLMGRVSNLEISADESGGDTGTTGGEDFARPIQTATTAPLNIQRKENTSAQEVPPNALPGSVFSAPIPRAASAEPSSGAATAASENAEPARKSSQSPGASKSSDPSRPPLALKSSLTSSVFSAPTSTTSRIPVFVSPSKAKAPATPSPSKKRPAEPHDALSGDAQPSPAKKRLLETPSAATHLSPSPALSRGVVESAAPTTSLSVPNGNQGGMRRPSGYFAQRRSLTPNGGNTPNASRSPSPAPITQQEPSAVKSPQQRQSSMEPAPSGSSAQVQGNDVVTLPGSLLLVEPPKDRASAPATALTAPTVIVTPDEAQDDVQLDMMDVESEQQMAIVPRRSLVFSDPLPPGEEYDDVPSISIKEFFLMTGIKFHDYTIPRRSTIHPSQLQGDRRDSSVPPSMADYLTAMVVHIPQLELYRLITKDLQTFIDNSNRIYHEAEEEVAKLTPILFREYQQANEEAREELLHQLKLIKANRLIAAKERWYDVRSRWVQGLQENVDRGFAELEQDRDALTDVIEQAQALLPGLRHQHAQVQAQLERERADIKDIENSDPAYLEELKATIDEQNQLLDVYKTDLAEGSVKIERLEGKLEELEAQRLENAQAIETAERRITFNKTSTRAEVFRLKDELECLQVLHSWRVSRVSPQLVQLVFTERFLVTVPCIKYRPLTPNIDIMIIEGGDGSKRPKEVDLYPLFSELVVRQAEVFARDISTTSIKRVVEELSDFWTSCSQIRTQITFLGIKYPLKLELVESSGSATSLRVIASILSRKRRTKVLVAFVFSPEVLARWPFEIAKLQCEVKSAYGNIDPQEFRTAVLERLSESSVEDNHACLLDSCVEASSRLE